MDFGREHELHTAHAHEFAHTGRRSRGVRRRVAIGGDDSRSRAVREAIREYTETHERLEATTGDVVALLAFDYEHHRVIESLHTAHHEFQDVIGATSHTHQDEWCLEAVFCRGDAKRVVEAGSPAP